MKGRGAGGWGGGSVTVDFGQIYSIQLHTLQRLLACLKDQYQKSGPKVPLFTENKNQKEPFLFKLERKLQRIKKLLK